MIRTGLIILFTVALIGTASAQENCSAPFAPVVPDGATTSESELTAVRDQVMAFVRDSDSYQSCLGVYLRQMAAEAQREQEPVNEAVRSSMLARGAANQREKERVGEEFNNAVRAFNEAQSTLGE
jgi:hypothetical protein